MAAAAAGPSSRPVNFPRAPSPLNDSQRPALTSASAASFKTAQSAFSPSQSRSSFQSADSFESAHTIPVRSPHIPDEALNPMALMTQAGAQEMHIVKVTTDRVEVHSGSPTEPALQRAGKSIARVFTHHGLYNEPEGLVGPPPPSPPASIEQDTDRSLPPPSPSPKMGISRSEPAQASQRLNFDPTQRGYSVGSRDRVTNRSSLPVADPDTSRPRASTETRASTRNSVTSISQRPSRSSYQSDDIVSSAASAGIKSLAHTSVDGYLQPPPASLHRPTRRNTTGSAHTSTSTRPSRTLTHMHHQSTLQARPSLHEDGDTIGELDSDILQQADQIRRERLSKRKAQQEAEAALTRAVKHEEKQVLVGNLIGEDHVNYVLMYNMLTGIRIGVSRCQAKIKRPLTDEDFKARHKFSFDIVGNELTPSAKYDFKFKDYAPWVFRELREDYFGLDPADYLLSLTAKYILSELGSPGKSGSFFYFSRDYRFIIKTIHHTEHKFLRSILRQYHAHVRDNPHTLLSRFYGLHRVKLPHGRKIHFVIMNNLFPPHKDVHETYDLKGSTVGRLYPEEKAEKNPRATLKDLNWINRGKSLELGPENRALLTEQLRRDSELLKRLRVMDYSLLIGIHNMQRGNRDNVRSNTLKVFSPSVPPIRRKATPAKGPSPEAIAMRRAMRESDPKRLGARDSLNLPETATGDSQQFLFYKDEGGLRATDEANQPQDTIYYLGVIDILTPYTVLKRVENLWKGLSADRHKISPVPPDEYGNRFFDFMKAIMRGGGGAERFKSE